jgi:putative inorganic carbon (HCO3(-)) transporter
MRIVAGVIIALGLVMGFVGVLGLRFSEKFIPLPTLTLFLPQIDFPFLNPRGFTPNIVAGAVAPIIPICWAWGMDRSSRRGQRALLLIISLLFCAIVGLTQSRGAVLGLAIAVLVLILWRFPRLAWLVPAAAVIVGITLYLVGVERAANAVLGLDSTGNVFGRLELWSRAMFMLQDFPYTGIGLGLFEPMVAALYPVFLNSTDAPLPHSHNLYLQMGVDYGIPGFVAFVGLVVTALTVGILTFLRSRSLPEGWLSAGVLAGYLVYLVHGMLDAVAVSTKVSVIIFFLLALLVRLDLQRRQQAP